jgi:glycosyltransferase involved in cell wall biosynthesis
VSKPTYSIVVPVHDEQEVLRELHHRLTSVLAELDGSAEIILVDDGSRDASYPLMLALHAEDPRVKVVQLSRNFGHQLAISAGMTLANGAAVIVMDADLQHPPELLPSLAARWREGYDVVYGVMVDRPTESPLKRVTARWFYRLLARLSDIEVPPAAGDFRLVDRKVVESFLAMRERNRYIRGMFSWLGFRQIGVEYACPPRFAGRSKYTFRRMMRFARDGILSFSNVPLRAMLKLGFAVSALAVAAGVAAIVAKLTGHGVPGYASIVVSISFLGGVQLLVLGVIGEYIARIHDEVRDRPLFVISDLRGFDPELRERTPELLAARSLPRV